MTSSLKEAAIAANDQKDQTQNDVNTITPKPLKTLGCHLIELNTALNLKKDSRLEASGDLDYA